MIKPPYSEISDSELSLRDKLAISRTVLANERTLLAYLRTAIAFFIAGASLIHFFKAPVLEIVGWIFLPLGILFVFIGIKRYRQMSKATDV